MNKQVYKTKLGFLECKTCKSFRMSVIIPFNKSVMDKFDEHVNQCSGISAQKDNITLGYN